MSRFQDTVRRVKNIFKINNVYDCARPLLLVLGVFGVGATRIRNTEGVYSVHNTRYSTLVTVFMSFLAPTFMIVLSFTLFRARNLLNYGLSGIIHYIILFFALFISMFTVCVGYIMASVSCKRLERVLHIIHNVDRQLAEVNIRVQHWHITLKVAVVALGSFNYTDILDYLRKVTETGHYSLLIFLSCKIIFRFFFLWVILFALIIHERFVCLNKVLQQDATITNIRIVGERRRRDNYILRRVQLARHVHEQLIEAVQLFSDICRYVVMGLLAGSMISILLSSYIVIVHHKLLFFTTLAVPFQIVVLIYICQANKNERRVRTARIRHLLAFETNREIIQELQQYTMYNAHAPSGPIDFQFTSMDNVLLHTIIDVIVSNILIIYSYTRHWT